MKTRAVLLVPVSLAACASQTGHGAVERSFRRPEADQIRLASLDIAVVTSGPPRLAEESFAIRTYEPPSPDLPIALGPDDRATQLALISSLRETLKSAGFDITFHVSSEAAWTSTTATPGAEVLTFGPQATLADLLKSAAGDAVLVVRAVPVDEWFVDVGEGTRTQQTALGRERVRDYRPAKREGRLLVGQVFLFDRKTGVRLWTKQAPDYPDGGRLVPNHPFLRYGWGRDPNAGGPPPAETERARRGADGFVKTMLADFPAAKEGDPGARAALDAIDVGLERTAQAFLDEGYVALELGVGWGWEPIRIQSEFYGEPLPELGNGALAPNGLPRVTPRVSFVTTGGLVWSLAVPLGLSPSSFGRTYHMDNPNPSSLMMPEDRAVQIGAGGVTSFGVEASLGPLVRLAETVLLIPRGGLTGELWLIDATPSSVVRDTTHIRLGVLGGADLWLLAGPEGPLFGKLGVDGRIGYDAQDSLIGGYAVTAAVGLLL